VAAEEREEKEDARISGAYGDGGRAEDAEAEAAERAKAACGLSPGLSGRALRGKAEFDRVFREGRRHREGGLVVLVAPVENESSWKLGMMVSRKKGTAVQRNRFRRCIREWFRKHSETVPAGRWYVVIPSGSVDDEPGEAFYDRLAALISRVAASPEGGRA
jgi:ribonuclease P protein component